MRTASVDEAGALDELGGPGGDQDDSRGLRARIPVHGGSALRGGVSRGDLLAPSAERAHAHSGALPGGGERAPGRGSAHGGDERAARGQSGARGLELDAPIARGGYRWVYLDAVSDDGRDAIVVIAMLGAPFSPWYARDRGADPLGFCAFNVGLYGSRGRAWSLVETDRIDRAPEALRIGGSHIVRDGSRLTAVIDARRSYGRSIRGRVRVDTLEWHGDDVALDVHGLHAWRPLAPRARVQVEMDEPKAHWSGWGYVDSNHGAEPLERALLHWVWSRAHVGDGGTLVSYDAHARGGAVTRVRRIFDSHGEARDIELATVPLPRTGWALAREAHADPGRAVRVVRTLEDTPFYARSLVETHVRGARTVAMHESLSLGRFAKPWVRLLLPFRIRREGGP